MNGKFILLYLAGLTFGLKAAAQMNVGSSAAPSASAMLQVTSSNKGFLPPQVALTGLTDVSTISSPATGLFVYCTGSGGLSAGYYYYNGATWVAFANGNTPWSNTGNSGTSSSSNFVGTTDNHPLLVKTNGVTKLFIDSATKYIGINNSNPQAMLDIMGTKASNNTTLNLIDSVNDFTQVNIQNLSLGTGGQAGYTATANNGTNTTGFAWMGINNQNFNNPQPWNIGGGDDVSFMGFGNNLYISNMSTSKPIIFTTGQAATPYYAERMRITNAGYVGIGTTAPTYPLQIGSSINTSISNYGYLNSTSPTGLIFGSSGTSPFSIYAAGRMAASEFDAFSDRRIKEKIMPMDIDSASHLIGTLQTVSYEYIDKPVKGDRRKIGFISQQVEQVVPSAVNKTSEFIPNIFTMVTDGTSTVACKTNDIREGDEVRVLTSTGEKIVHVAAASPEHITLDWGAERPETKYFVYGTRVHDFRTIDFDQLTTICVGAIQKLQKDNEQIRKQLEILSKAAKMSRKERKRLFQDLP